MDAQQKGAVLIVSIIVLLVLTLISVTAMQTTSLEEKMAGNMRNKNLAFQAAEASLRAGEGYLSGATLDSFDGTNGLYQPYTGSEQRWEIVDWYTPANVRTYDEDLDGGDLNDLASMPTYIIEELSVEETGGSLEAGTVHDGKLYRVTSRGVGGTANAMVMLQSVFRR
ncbi:MAG: PilX N-terminal domain-containing pilus assembly protein [Gammaproteobacteria bacterium]|nr:PilX N-terminal domain-containing pilus assembly protein [Gammaproteobacteria bacterium]